MQDTPLAADELAPGLRAGGNRDVDRSLDASENNVRTQRSLRDGHVQLGQQTVAVTLEHGVRGNPDLDT